MLACVIGTLTLLLAAMTLGRMGGPSLEQVWLAERYAAVQAILADARTDLARLEREARETRQREQEREKLHRRLAGLGLSPNISLQELAGAVRLRSEAEALADRRAQLEEEGSELAAKVRESEAEIEARRAAQLLAPIVIEPSGLGREQSPYLVECNSDYVELRSVKRDVSFRVVQSEILGDGPFRVFLRRVRAIRSGIVIFLIRPDGVETYGIAATAADRQRVRHAKLPLPGQGELDLGLF